MIFNDYANAKNIAHNWIHWPCIRVSTIQIPSYFNGSPFGVWYETFIFANCPQVRTKQIHYNTKNKAKIIKAHNHIINNLKNRLQALNKP